MIFREFDPKIHDVYKVAELVYDVDERTFVNIFSSREEGIEAIKERLLYDFSLEDEDENELYYVFFDEDKEHETTKYMGYVFQTPRVLSVLRRLGKGIMFIDRGHGRINTCRLKVSRYDLFHLPLPLPPASERIEIIAFLQRECNVVDAIISKKQEQLATLAAYKKSLIYEYVTGKKEVPTDE